MLKRRYLFVQILCITFTVLLTNAGAQNKKLTYKQAYERGKPRLLKALADVEAWLDDEHYLLSELGEDGRTALKLVKGSATTGKESVYIDFKLYDKKLPPGLSFEDYDDHTDDYTGFVFTHENDLYYFSKDADTLKRLTSDTAEEKIPHFSPNGKRVAFTRNNDLYVIDIESGKERRLTHDGSDVITNGWASWVYYEEIIGRRSRYAAFWWSPNSEMIAFLRFDDTPVPKFYITKADGSHGELETQHYPKSGDPNPFVKLGVAHVDKGKIVWMDIEEKADHYVAWPSWTPDSEQLLFQWMNRGQDHIKIYAADPNTGAKKEVYDEKQPAWVEFFEDITIFKDGSGFLLRSDVDGWHHLYYYDMTGNLKKCLTQGDWRVRDIHRVDEDHKKVFFHGSREKSTETHLFCVDLNSGQIKKLTESAGTHRCHVSPDGRFVIDTWSDIHQPSRRQLKTTEGKHIRDMGDEKLPLLDEVALGKAELFTIPSGDGYDLPAVWTLPPEFNESKKYPIIFSIYSGPNSARVANRFSSLNTHFLAQQGIITITVDHRGSGHFGKKGVALMHRSLGKWEMHDLITAIKWLIQQPFIDPERIGITGGSYGGYTTCMALTYGADYFTHGLAHAPVTDWRLYDTVYTERYMDTPDENPEGYTFGSVLTHAHLLKGQLRITHGTIDDNVHMQNTIQLIDIFQNMGKNFELMIYPNQRHGIRGKKRNHSNREGVEFWFRHFLGKDFDIEEGES